MNLEEVIQEAYDLGAKTLYDNPERTSHGTTVKYREQADKDVEQLVNKYDLLHNVRQTLPKRLSNSAYLRAKNSRYEDFMSWWDEQV